MFWTRTAAPLLVARIVPALLMPFAKARMSWTTIPFWPAEIVPLLVMPPEVMVFFNRPGGYMFLAALLVAAMDGADGSHAAVSYADVGERFGYSRTHVRQVLMDAEAAGLVRLHSRGGHNVEILPALWSGHDKGVAIGMCLHDMVYARTAADWRR